MTLQYLGVRVLEVLMVEAHHQQEKLDNHSWMTCSENYKYGMILELLCARSILLRI